MSRDDWRKDKDREKARRERRDVYESDRWVDDWLKSNTPEDHQRHDPGPSRWTRDRIRALQSQGVVILSAEEVVVGGKLILGSMFLAATRARYASPMKDETGRVLKGLSTRDSLAVFDQQGEHVFPTDREAATVKSLWVALARQVGFDESPDWEGAGQHLLSLGVKRIPINPKFAVFFPPEARPSEMPRGMIFVRTVEPTDVVIDWTK